MAARWVELSDVYVHSNSSRLIKISRKPQIFICHVTIQAHNRPLRKPEFLIEASNSARKQTQYIQNNKKIYCKICGKKIGLNIRTTHMGESRIVRRSNQTLTTPVRFVICRSGQK